MDSNSEFELGIKCQQEQPCVQEVQKEEEVAKTMDRISELPDDMIAEVLSFLDTKEAIRTCLLSSRWRYTWKGINRIFLDGYESHPDNFVNLVNHVLKNCSSSKFLAFELYYPNTTDHTSGVSPLVQFILTLNIEKLIIYAASREKFPEDFLMGEPLVLKCSLSCTNLVVLKLYHLDIEIPDSVVCFPHLQSIDLGPIFSDYGTVNQLLRRCPVLKELLLFGVLEFPEELTIDISVSTLRRLTLQIADSCFIKRTECNILINTPYLNYLSIHDDSYARYVVKDRTRLENVIVNYDGRPSVSDKVPHLLRLFNGNKHHWGPEIALAHSGSFKCTWPTFPCLKKLIMNMNLSLNSDLTFFSKVLHNTPCLEVLVLDLEWIRNGRLNQNTNRRTLPDSVPNCVSEHLKVTEIQSFKGDEDILQIVEYLLNNAHVLERMIIDFKQNTMDEEAVKKIRMFPKASKACCIQIYPH